MPGSSRANPGNKSSALEAVGKVEIDKERAASPTGAARKSEFNPTLTPDLERAARAPMSLRTGLVPAPQPELPLPEKGLELGL